MYKCILFGHKYLKLSQDQVHVWEPKMKVGRLSNVSNGSNGSNGSSYKGNGDKVNEVDEKIDGMDAIDRMRIQATQEVLIRLVSFFPLLTI